MELVSFIAHSAVDAVAQIRARLGPDAVVVHIRSLPIRGVARFWRKPQFEVLAGRPPEGAAHHLDATSDAPATPLPPEPTGGTAVAAETSSGSAAAARVAADMGGHGTAPGEVLRWPVGKVLEQAGFTPVSVQRILDYLEQRGSRPEGQDLRQQLVLVRDALYHLWRNPPPLAPTSLRPHILVGPPGSGKTTCLCKWLAQTALVEGRPARVWRLDGTTANTAESLEVYAQALGIPIERAWQLQREPDEHTVQFIDLPGTDWLRTDALQELARQIRSYPSPQVHLVLNGGYDTHLLLRQVRAFGVLPVEDLILTHLDEELRWGKAWDLILGTNFPVRFLSAGQNIPGDFHVATPDRLFSRQSPL